jgi:hypothetical protein
VLPSNPAKMSPPRNNKSTDGKIPQQLECKIGEGMLGSTSTCLDGQQQRWQHLHFVQAFRFGTVDFFTNYTAGLRHLNTDLVPLEAAHDMDADPDDVASKTF